MGSNKKKKSKKREIEDTEVNERSAVSTSLQEIHTEDKINDEEVEDRLKRKHNDDGDEDMEQSPKKVKKKKKKPLEPEPDTTSKKTKKSIRQMKKEKYAKRQAEAEIAAKDELKSQCLTYLSQWKHDKQNWKFMKNKQVWLLKNKFSTHLIPKESWPILLEYFESAKGNIRNLLLEDAHKIIKQMDKWTEEQEKDCENNDEGAENSNEIKKPDDIAYSRARSLIQCLEE